MDGFIDLRLNRQQAQTEEGFWPSFTDIMTVIVMIFLLAMVVLLVRNMELVNQLRATMEAERMAAELARSTSEEKEHLALRLMETENELSMLRMEAMRLQEEKQDQTRTLGEQQQELNRVRAHRDQLTLQTETLRSQVQRLSETLAAARSELNAVRSEYDTLSQNNARLAEAHADLQNDNRLAVAELSSLRSAYRQQSRQLEALTAQSQLSVDALTKLREEYTDLKVKYDKLFKPARTAVGNFVVEVRYTKEAGRFRIAYRPQDREGFTELSRADLHRALAELQSAHPNRLYVKVIIPKDSGLSYSEAWEFTSEVLKSYDYYYQEGSPQAQPDRGAEAG